MRFQHQLQMSITWNVLLDDDVAGRARSYTNCEVAAPQEWRPAKPAVEIACEIVRFATNNFAQRPHESALPIQRMEGSRGSGSLRRGSAFLRRASRFQYFHCTRHIHGHRLFEIHVLPAATAASNAGMIIRGRGDDDGVHFLRSGNLLESFRAPRKAAKRPTPG